MRCGNKAGITAVYRVTWLMADRQDAAQSRRPRKDNQGAYVFRSGGRCCVRSLCLGLWPVCRPQQRESGRPLVDAGRPLVDPWRRCRDRCRRCRRSGIVQAQSCKGGSRTDGRLAEPRQRDSSHRIRRPIARHGRYRRRDVKFATADRERRAVPLQTLSSLHVRDGRRRRQPSMKNAKRIMQFGLRMTFFYS